MCSAGGLVAGSLVLIGGEPGIGKSTLVLQNILSIRNRTILYVSGEESAAQLKMRADRIGRRGDNCFIVTETSLDSIFEHISAVQPQLLIVDSIQTIASDAIESAAGSVSQVRECAAQLLRYAKESGVPVILIGHINKEGSIAGPKVLEHIVDAVLQFEGDRHYMYRILRSIKNRFGSTSELGIYEMCQRGLREVTNPSEMLLSQSSEDLSGIAIGVTLEGMRPFLIEAAGIGKHCGLRHTATVGDRFRFQAYEHAACSAGEAGRVQARAERCVPQYRRRTESQRSGA